MLTADFDFQLPPQLIAQTPADPRDSSRLMAVDRRTATIQHRHFRDIVAYLKSGDLLVWNNSKVFKARLLGRPVLAPESDDVEDSLEADCHPTGKILNVPRLVEVLLVRPAENKGVWRVLAKPARRLRLGMKVQFASDFVGEVLFKATDGTILMQFDDEDFIVRQKANKYGFVPVPPYIRTSDFRLQASRLRSGRGLDFLTSPLKSEVQWTEDQYQTVYAKHEGSVAAPTAGFHFTPELIEALARQGVQFAEVTLHVGLGTFQPVKTDKVERHRMHSEWVELTAKNADLINQAKAEGRRVVAVGTTTVRTLEGIGQMFGELHPYTGEINLFIIPGFAFKAVDALITNFHLPRSTLLMLVAAFMGQERAETEKSGQQFTLQCYNEAIAKGYRFYSFGDAMFV